MTKKVQRPSKIAAESETEDSEFEVLDSIDELLQQVLVSVQSAESNESILNPQDVDRFLTLVVNLNHNHQFAAASQHSIRLIFKILAQITILPHDRKVINKLLAQIPRMLLFLPKFTINLLRYSIYIVSDLINLTGYDDKIINKLVNTASDALRFKDDDFNIELNKIDVDLLVTQSVTSDGLFPDNITFATICYSILEKIENLQQPSSICNQFEPCAILHMLGVKIEFPKQFSSIYDELRFSKLLNIDICEKIVKLFKTNKPLDVSELKLAIHLMKNDLQFLVSQLSNENPVIRLQALIELESVDIPYLTIVDQLVDVNSSVRQQAAKNILLMLVRHPQQYDIIDAFIEKIVFVGIELEKILSEFMSKFYEQFVIYLKESQQINHFCEILLKRSQLYQLLSTCQENYDSQDVVRIQILQKEFKQEFSLLYPFDISICQQIIDNNYSVDFVPLFKKDIQQKLADYCFNQVLESNNPNFPEIIKYFPSKTIDAQLLLQQLLQCVEPNRITRILPILDNITDNQSRFKISCSTLFDFCIKLQHYDFGDSDYFKADRLFRKNNLLLVLQIIVKLIGCCQLDSSDLSNQNTQISKSNLLLSQDYSDLPDIIDLFFTRILMQNESSLELKAAFSRSKSLVHQDKLIDDSLTTLSQCGCQDLQCYLNILWNLVSLMNGDLIEQKKILILLCEKLHDILKTNMLNQMQLKMQEPDQQIESQLQVTGVCLEFIVLHISHLGKYMNLQLMVVILSIFFMQPTTFKISLPKDAAEFIISQFLSVEISPKLFPILYFITYLDLVKQQHVKSLIKQKINELALAYQQLKEQNNISKAQSVLPEYSLYYYVFFIRQLQHDFQGQLNIVKLAEVFFSLIELKQKSVSVGVLNTLKRNGKDNKFINVCDVFLSFLGGVQESAVGYPIQVFQ